MIFSDLAARVVSRSSRSLKRKSWARLCDCCCDLVPQAVRKASFKILITPTPGGAWKTVVERSHALGFVLMEFADV